MEPIHTRTMTTYNGIGTIHTRIKAIRYNNCERVVNFSMLLIETIERE